MSKICDINRMILSKTYITYRGCKVQKEFVVGCKPGELWVLVLVGGRLGKQQEPLEGSKQENMPEPLDQGSNWENMPSEPLERSRWVNLPELVAKQEEILVRHIPEECQQMMVVVEDNQRTPTTTSNNSEITSIMIRLYTKPQYKSKKISSYHRMTIIL